MATGSNVRTVKYVTNVFKVSYMDFQEIIDEVIVAVA